MASLEPPHMEIFLVGGAVRDRLLDLPVKERDWVVVGATEGEMLAQGFRPADAAFPVFLHPETGEEYALARTEVKTGPGYKGFEVQAGPEVTLEQDLARRDLTINAIAQDAAGNLIDPYGGQDDLADGMLRHITPAFVEDPVRLLRTARFAATLGQWGFRLAHGTHALMTRMAAAGEMATLRPERVWREMEIALRSTQPWRFFEVLHRCGALAYLIPELAKALGEPTGHGRGGKPEPLAALERAARQGAEPAVRFAVLFADVIDGAGCEAFGARLRVDRASLETLTLLLARRSELMGAGGGDAASALSILHDLRANRQPERFERLLACMGALESDGFGAGEKRLRVALEAFAGVDAAMVQAAGFQGKALGEELKRRQLEAIAGRLVATGAV